MGVLVALVAICTILLAMGTFSILVWRQVKRVVDAERAEREKAELAITDLTAQLEDLTRKVDHLFERSQSSSDHSISVSSGPRETLDMIDSLSERVSKVADISFRELARLGERVDDLAQLANHNRSAPGGGDAAQL